MTKPPKSIKSDGYGSSYVVIDASTGIPLSGVLILMVEYHKEFIPLLRELGYDEWADEQERKWEAIERDIDDSVRKWRDMEGDVDDSTRDTSVDNSG